jgi:cobalt-zinc-cadmium resistance protein CzcA
MRFNELMTGARQDVVVKIYGDDLDVLTEYANKMGAIVTSVQGAKDIYIEKVTGLPQIVVKLRRDNIARYGLTVQEINHVVNTAFAGQKAGVVFEGEKRFDLVVRLDSTYRKQISDVSTLNIAAGNRQIPLSEVADVSFINGPAQVQREDARRRIMVGFNVRGRDVESIVEELKQKTNAQIKLPPGYSLSYEGQFKNLEEAKSRLAIAVPAALLLIMMLLYFTFRSLKQTLLIFTAIPLAAIGGVLFLLLRGMPFSISAGVGFIALFGVAVLNGIVLIAEFNKLKKEGMEDVFQRIETGVMVRLRPVLMTAAVASLGFLPMAISQSGGAEVQRPLATVVIGGLITSTILTLVVLPALYLLIERRTKVKPALVAVLLLGLAFPAHAQQVYTIDEAAAKMLNTHPQAKAAAADVEEAAALKPAAWDMGKTSLGVQVGQFNSRAVDNGLSVSQSIPFPTQMVAQHKVYASVEQEKMLQQQLTKQDLLYQLRQCYIALQYEYAYRQRVQELDSVYSVLQYAADWRYKSGESTRLEQVNLLTRKQDMVLQLTQSGQEIMGLRKNLQWLLGDSALPNITPALPESDGVTLSENHIADHPSMKLYEQKIQTALLEQKKAGQALWPDLTVGLTNQTLVGYQNVDGTEQYYSKADRFTAVQLGVAVPLIWGPQNARIKAARKQVTAAGARADAWERQLTATYDKTQQETESALTALRYYESQALPNAELISSKAYAAFKAGDIGYLELLQSLDTAYNIYRQYLAAQRDLRLKQLSLLYLNGSL